MVSEEAELFRAEISRMRIGGISRPELGDRTVSGIDRSSYSGIGVLPAQGLVGFCGMSKDWWVFLLRSWCASCSRIGRVFLVSFLLRDYCCFVGNSGVGEVSCSGIGGFFSPSFSVSGHGLGWEVLPLCSQLC